MSMERWNGLRPTDVVVIPAHNEAEVIGDVITYLLDHGVHGKQIVVVESGCTDDTGAAAMRAATAHPACGDQLRVVVQEDVLTRHAEALRAYGVVETRGKGGAMYAAVLELTRERRSGDTRVFFLDGDLKNPNEVDPIGCLLTAWEQNPHARLVKLASAGRDNEGIHAFMNMLPRPWRLMSSLAWPLCGQQGMYLRDLQSTPFPTGYCIEVALLAATVEHYGLEGLAQEPIPVPLLEQPCEDALPRYVAMYTVIVHFLRRVADYRGLTVLGNEEVRQWNIPSGRRVEDIAMPHAQRTLGARTAFDIDALLPPVRWIGL